jgi:uncharacterized membrane protein
MKDIITFAITMLFLDLVSIKLIIGPAYKKFIPGLSVKMVFAVLAYATMISSWYLIKGSVAKAALTGFVIYGTYAFTLAAVFPGYPITLGLTEIAWGTSLFAICTIVSNYLGNI